MLRAVAAQSMSPTGTFGFFAGVSQIDSGGANGGAFLGIINFDGAGNVSGTTTIKLRNTDPQRAPAIPATFTGTYSSNRDGTGSVTLNSSVGFTATLAMVMTDGGQGIQLLETGCLPCGADIPLRGQPASLTGGLPISLFFQGATGNIPLTLSAVNSPTGGTTIYTAAAATGTGPAQCPDGSAGTWTASVPSATVALNPDIPFLVMKGGNVSGNFLAAVFGTVCGQPDFETLSGLVTGTVSPGGATSLVLHGAGAVANGIARVAGGSSLNGSYGVQLNYSPFPAGSVGLMKFDGAGNVALSITSAGLASGAPATATFTGTYSINPDGSGTINLTATSGQAAAPSFAFVITDDGSQLLLMRIDNNTGFNVAFGTARLQ
jgi:hypothetical protein